MGGNVSVMLAQRSMFTVSLAAAWVLGSGAGVSTGATQSDTQRPLPTTPLGEDEQPANDIIDALQSCSATIGMGSNVVFPFVSETKTSGTINCPGDIATEVDATTLVAGQEDSNGNACISSSCSVTTLGAIHSCSAPAIGVVTGKGLPSGGTDGQIMQHNAPCK